MNKQQIKQATIEQLKQVSPGYQYGDIKTIIIDNTLRDEGYAAIFYKKCRAFETYKGQDTRPCEIYVYYIEKDEDGQHFTLDLYTDINGKDEEWQEKKTERLTDREFVETII